MHDFTTAQKLNERIKELTCLYEVSKTLLNGDPVADTLQQVCAIVKQAWLHPSQAVVELDFDGHHYLTGALRDRTVFQHADICLFNEVKGNIRVHYDASEFSAADFLEDEQRLLATVAAAIGGYYERHINAEKITLLRRSAERTDRLSILGEITAGIAHELNTPLGNILGFAELIHEKSTDIQSREDSAKVVKAAIYSREIVKKLMFFSCEMPQHLEFVEIGPLVNDALRLLQPNFRKAGVQYEFNIANAEVAAQVDGIQLTQVLFNILMNSIYFSPVNSTITINIGNDDTWLFLDIADRGAGIGDKSKIFDPFFTTKPFGEGTGLGLSVVHGIIRSHNGTIAVRDNKPAGTIFNIRLPLKHQ